jgi:serine/threonine-protein kinase
VTDSPRHPTDAWIGRVIAEKYTITRCLGVGGHGAVFEAENAWTGRRVALKVLLGAAALNAEMAERFLREARATTRVAHPHIIEVLDMGRDPVDGSLYIVQELLQGEDLREVLRRERTVDPHWLIETLAPILEALAVAHAQGVVHRDLKPANLYLARQHDGRIVPKLIDFGVSRMEDSPEAHEITHAGALLGTPDYMSPEQARGDRAGAQADVWAVGVVLYESLAGQRPYRAANYNALLIRILADDAPPLRSHVPGVPESLAVIVHKALARDTAERFQSVAALRDALVRWAASNPRLATSHDATPSAQMFLDIVAAPPADDVTPVSVSQPGMLHESMVGAPDVTEESPAAVRPETLPAPARTTSVAPLTPAPVATPATWEKRRSAPPREAPRSVLPWVFVGLTTVAAATVAAAWITTRPPPPVVLTRPVEVVPAVTVPTDVGTVAADLGAAAVDGAALDAAVAVVEEPTVDAGAPDAVLPARPRVVIRPLPPPSLERPDALEIRRVMVSATSGVGNCVNGREATVAVNVVILATGVVEAVTVAPPWGETPAGACVAAVLRRLRFSRFRQERFRLAWPYVIRSAGAPQLGAPLTAR